MTSGFSVRDSLARGLGRAASLLGEPYDLFRPHDPIEPLASGNRIMRLPVLFDDLPTKDASIAGAPVFRASFDGIGTRVGDYLKGPLGVFFIATLPARRRSACVLTNVTVEVCRSEGPTRPGLNSYGGVTTAALEYKLRQWPGRAELRASVTKGVLPVDRERTKWLFWLPPTPVPVEPGDMLIATARYVVDAVEAIESGWRLSVSGTEI